ncbi:nucleotide-diphospho-sugar transferase [Collybia nuda]|uniref:Translation initiation factor eIF2B subunit epsilon n=1 Tax=Collybia nuda TaxID=64659 RepID=A0A9P6C961_9AGAR|nr:nucleotide-diphospho-sugar transferase [Collybia nuda]
MPPKSSSTGKEKLIDEEVLQAIILADSFNKRFRPLTARRPRCLLPICNAPLLDWTFESLALAGVQEIFVICRSFAEQVRVAIKESRWSKPGSGIKIVPILTAKETFSPGDAMRDIYTRGLVTSDFVLVMGDLVSNIRIDEVVRVHKERRKTNKDAIMTMVVKESGAQHRTKARGDSSIFVLDAETSECLHYEPIMGYPQTKVAHIPREVFAEHPEIEVRNDLIDCSIDVCSVEVPSLFQDNFDYLDIRKDFVHGVLTSDLLMKNIHCYVAKEGYAARVKDTKSYDSVSKDILSRWTFPLVPDDNHPGGHIYEHIRGNKYIAKDNSVLLARTCKVGNNTLIGSSTQIHENTQVTASVIGRNCIIGPGTIIRDAYIFDGTEIGSYCVIERSIIGSGAKIKDNSRVQRGSLIGDGVIVGPSVTLGPFERLSKKRDTMDENESDGEDVDSDLEEVEANQDSYPNVLGEQSNALVWPKGPPVDNDEEDELANYNNERFMRIGDDASDLDFSDIGSMTSDSESDTEDDSSDLDVRHKSLTAPSDTSLPLEIPSTGVPMAETEFRMEVTQSLERAFAEGHSVDNAAVELKTLRMASNVPLTRVREAVVAGIVERIRIVEGGGIPQRKEIASVIGRWGELIDKIGGIDPVETISALQTHCALSLRMPLFGQILAALYQDDIVEEDHIRKWYALSTSRGEGNKPLAESENIKKCWSIVAHMIKQFDEQESDDESEEDGLSPIDDKPAVVNKGQEDSASDDDESGDESNDENVGEPPSGLRSWSVEKGNEGVEKIGEPEDKNETAQSGKENKAETSKPPTMNIPVTLGDGTKPRVITEASQGVVSNKGDTKGEDDDDEDSEEGERMTRRHAIMPEVPNIRATSGLTTRASVPGATKTETEQQHLGISKQDNSTQDTNNVADPISGPLKSISSALPQDQALLSSWAKDDDQDEEDDDESDDDDNEGEDDEETDEEEDIEGSEESDDSTNAMLES